MQSSITHALLAAHRFGYGEPDPAALTDPRAWVLQQFDRSAALQTGGLLDSAQAIALGRRALREAARAGGDKASGGATPDLRDARRELRRANVRALQARWQHMASTPTPVVERWVSFWSNHFSISATKATVAGLVIPFENEAIRPHVLGRFDDLLRAATLHPGMLLYLDNAQSVGPRSRFGSRRDKGLNENLARELLELHTLGVNGGYTQNDVTETAKILTGWTLRRQDAGESGFVAALHEPGDKHVLGQRYREGPQALDALLRDLARRPASADFLATKLVRHFVAETPPPALVQAVATSFRRSEGDLRHVAHTLFSHDLAWQSAPPRYKRPEDWIISAHRVLGQPVERAERWWTAATAMGQSIARAPSPQGWSDAEADWLSPDALWKRTEFASAAGAAWGNRIDARQAAARAHGPDWSEASKTALERAESPAQSLALWLASPEFMTR